MRDSFVFTECTTCKECYERIEKDMDNINKWLNINKLKLNENKSKLMEINIHTSLFGINNAVIGKVNSIKYLGLIIDRNLKLKEHLECICII